MKNTCFALLAVFFALAASMHAESMIKDGSSLRVVAEEVSPEPVEPGQDLTVKVRVYNDYVYGIPGYGNGSAYNASVSLDVKYPFYLKTGHNMDEPQICTGCSKDYAYYLAVDAGAVSGVYPLTVKITKGAIEREYDISVMVVGVPDVVYDASPPASPAQAGSNYSVSTIFRNIGTGTARNIKVYSSSEKFVILGAGQKVIESLKPGNEKDLQIAFDVDESVKTGSYSIPIQVSYVDEKGKSYSSSGQIGVKDVNPAKLGIESLKTVPEGTLTAGDTVSAQVRVENMGLGDAENVRAVMTLSDGTRIVSFLGKLKPDDDAPAVFSFTPDAAGNYTYRIALQYEDDYGTHASEESLSVRVKEKSNGIPSYAAAAAAVAAILVIGFIIRKK